MLNNRSCTYADGQVGFERVFTVVNASPGYEVSIAENVNSIALQRSVETNGDWKIENETKDDIAGKQVLSLDGRLTLKQDGETFFRTLFISSPTIDNPNSLGADEKTLSLGERLIAKNDCKTCHNAKVQTVGPAYIQIAERYPMEQSEIIRLSNKIIKGGGGIWGSQVMSAHPELPVSDANEMVRYILSLDTTDAGQKGGQGVATEMIAELKEANDMLPGLLVEAYTNLKGLEKLPVIPASKSADQAGIISDFQGMDANDFGGLTEDFVIIATGYYMWIKKPRGVRIMSDDGPSWT